MASIVWSDVTDAITTVPSTAVALQTLILALVNGTVDPDIFDGEDGDITKYVRILYAAHMAVMHGRGATGAPGPITSESAGGLSRSYGSLPASSELALTGPGTLLRQLIRTSAARSPHLVLGCY